MADVSRLRVVWSGTGVVGGGVTTWYTKGPVASLQTAAKAFFGGGLLTTLPTTVQVTVPSTGDVLDVDTGEINGAWSSGTAGVYTGTATDVYAAGVGMRVVWDTAGIRNGRRVKGSTFIVPIRGGCYAVDGTLQAVTVTDITTAATAVIVATTTDFCVYSRPKPGLPGAVHAIMAATVPDRISWLRSRRT